MSLPEGDKFEYKSNFNPSLIRKMLGLDGHTADKLDIHERERLANLLYRSGHLTISDITNLGGWRVPNRDYGGDDVGGGIVFDPPPNSGLHPQK